MTPRRPRNPVFDLARVDARIREIADRLRETRQDLVGRLRRFAHAAEILVQPHRSLAELARHFREFTDAEFYGALWLLLIADLFRNAPDGAEFAADVIGLADSDCKELRRLVLAVSEKYYGAPTPFE